MSNLSYCRSTVGVFFLNAAEGWIDINKGETGIMGSLSNMVSGSQAQKQVIFPPSFRSCHFTSDGDPDPL